MSTEVTLPALGESVTEGTISRWLKKVGDRVEADEALLEVSTDKVDTEIPSPGAGVLLEIKADEDETVEVGAVLAVIGEEDEATGGGDSDDDESGDADEAEADEADAEGSTDVDAGNSASDEDAEDVQDETDQGPTPQKAQPEKPSGGKKKSSGKGTEVTLPALGESVTEGTISRWLKQVGDSVDVDEALVEISTDKVDTEVPSPVAGTVLEIKVDEDDTVEVGGVLCLIGDESDAGSEDDDSDDSTADSGSEESDAATVEDPEDQTEAGDEGGQDPVPAPADADDSGKAKKSEDEDGSSSSSKSSAQSAQGEQVTRSEDQKPAARAERAESSDKSSEQSKPAPKVAPRSQGDDSAYVTPLVRKLASQHNVDLGTLTGTGVGGRIRKQDVLAAAEDAKKASLATAPAQAGTEAPASQASSAQPSAEAAAKRGTTEKLSRMRQTIAKRMVESLQTSAQLTGTVEVDMTAISRIRAAAKDDFKARNGASLSYLPFITKAAVEALRQFPKINATIDTEAGTVTYSDAEHVGIAVDTEKGLMVPVIKDAGDLNIGGLAKKIADLASRTRNNKVTPDDLTGGTFTITNYGSAGTLFDTPIINQPQVAILGTGALVKRPMVMTDKNLGETIAIRDMMYLSLTYDHRLVDGADAARYLQAVKERLEEGDFGAEFGL